MEESGVEQMPPSPINPPEEESQDKEEDEEQVDDPQLSGEWKWRDDIRNGKVVRFNNTHHHHRNQGNMLHRANNGASARNQLG